MRRRRLQSAFRRAREADDAADDLRAGERCCSNTLDVLGAVRQAALVHKAAGDPTAVGAEQVVRMATIEGARALGLGDHLDSLEPGKRAGLIVLDLGGPHPRPRHDPWSTLAYAAHSADVRARSSRGGY